VSPSAELSVGLPSFAAADPGGWQHLFALARAADAAGVDRVTLSDHVAFGERLGEYARPELGGVAGGVQPTGPDGHWLEPVTTLAVIAGMTSRVRLRTNILIAALRRPVVLAKSAATLDVLSGGRLDLGVGVGWQREEYDAAGLRFEERGRLLDETLAVCATLWRERVAHHSSPRLAFDHIHQMPKPLQPGGVPVWVSGTLNPAVARRIGRFGAGWIRWGRDAEDPASVGRMTDLITAAGYEVDHLRVTGRIDLVMRPDGRPDPAATMSAVPALLAGGVTDVMLSALDPRLHEDPEGWLVPMTQAFRAAAGLPGPGDRD
jgi:probable F420-dependent oxidoreductase